MKYPTSKASWRNLALSLTVAGLVALAGLSGSERVNPHISKMPCNDCHLRDVAEMSEREAETRLFVTDIETLCLRCHTEVRLSMSHPTAVRPSFPLPADMYLDWKGELTCTTCHYMHQDPSVPYGAGNNKFLRRNSEGQAFCLECHQNDFLSNRSMGHGLAQETAHFTPVSESSDCEHRLDGFSESCLSCHDGSLARVAQTKSASSGIWRHTTSSGRESHPIGVSYQLAFEEKKYDYKAPGDLPSAIQLPGGNVECVSCHNIYSQNDNLLVVSNEGSRLCLTCHIK
ncbi:MAG: cytochrome c3 family protein [Deltaproteobacteria bacterium]|nr:cytochrome c3 family protein [Deltaproteobacteria bacterium]